MRLTHLSLAAVLMTAFGGAAFASDADFKLANKTGHQIDEVYVSRHSSDDWGRDRMGDSTLDDGETVAISFPHGGSACHYDIQVKYHEGGNAEWHDVNLCNYQKITLSVEGRQTVASGE